MSKKLHSKLVFMVTSSGFDEYPGDGLRICHDKQEYDKHFLNAMGLEVHEGDEVEVTARVISRVETKRVKITPEEEK